MRSTRFWFSQVFVLFVVIALCSTNPVSAAPVSCFGSAEITLGTSPDVEVGDVFHFAFTYDDEAVDTQGSAGAATFPTALTSFVMIADAGNSGSWDPSLGTVILPGRMNAFGGRVFVTPTIQGLPPIGGQEPLLILQLRLFDLNDTGAGQTFSEIVGPLPTELSEFDFGTLSALNLVTFAEEDLGLGDLTDWGKGDSPLPAQPSTWGAVKALY